MTARYRVVHFVPDPFTGARIPLAAIVAGGGGVSIASAGHVPGAVCLGRPSTYAAMQMVLESLSTVESLDVLPVAVGPHAVLDVEKAKALASAFDGSEKTADHTWVLNLVGAKTTGFGVEKNSLAEILESVATALSTASAAPTGA